jgi:NAD(FAD)-utilizing enzyme possibly involved in translation
MKEITIIGAGLAGSEAAYQLAKKGYKVKLYEMRPKKIRKFIQDQILLN